jgi:hypothetical protein
MAYRFGSKSRDATWAAGVWQAYSAGKGRLPICPHCGLEVQPTDPWDQCHTGPAAWTRTKNVLLPGHRACNVLDNATTQTPAAAKSRRVRQRHAGQHRSRHPLPCGRASPWTKAIGGRVMPRLSAAEKHRRALQARAFPAWAGK